MKINHDFFSGYKELGLLLIVVGVVGLTFSVLVFYAEKDNKEKEWTFLDSFCWGLMTLTTGKSAFDLTLNDAGFLVS